jgi:electron transfer DM13
MVTTFVRRHPLRSAFGAFAFVGIALLSVAYVIVPALVRSTLVEELPAAAGPATQTLVQGELVRINAVDYGSGSVRIVKIGDDRFVRFENVDIAAAPDMYVYISDRIDGQPGTFVDLGKLRATNGSFNYPIPATVDIASVKSLVVWCRQFSTTVTFAVLR